jgi:hypothetical protein
MPTARHGPVRGWGQPRSLSVEFSQIKRERRFAVAVGGVEKVDNHAFGVSVRKNGIPKSVEELSTYAHSPWIIRKFAAIMGMKRPALRRPSPVGGTIPISPTRRTQIIHNVGDLSTETGRLSPEDVESNVLWRPRMLVKWTRTYYALTGMTATRTGRSDYPPLGLSPNGRCKCG